MIDCTFQLVIFSIDAEFLVRRAERTDPPRQRVAKPTGALEAHHHQVLASGRCSLAETR